MRIVVISSFHLWYNKKDEKIQIFLLKSKEKLGEVYE